jgi:AcrR family transcriptional regulator
MATASAPRRARRGSAEVRRLILDAAVRAFSANGYAGATTEQIADDAGVNNSVMYRNFRTKGDLFREAVLQPFVDALRHFNARKSGDQYRTWPIERLTHEYVGEVFDSLADNRDALVGLVAAGNQLDPDVSRQIAALLEKIITEVTELGVSESEHRAEVSSAEMELTIRMVTAMIAGLVTFKPWLLPQGRRRIARDRMVDHMARLLAHGLRLTPADGSPPESSK